MAYLIIQENAFQMDVKENNFLLKIIQFNQFFIKELKYKVILL